MQGLHAKQPLARAPLYGNNTFTVQQELSKQDLAVIEQDS